MGDNLELEADQAPPAPGVNKVEITVAGHTIIVESGESLADVVGYAHTLFEQTDRAAERSPIGFDTTGGSFERADPYVEAAPLEDWEDEDARRLGR